MADIQILIQISITLINVILFEFNEFDCKSNKGFLRHTFIISDLIILKCSHL